MSKIKISTLIKSAIILIFILEFGLLRPLGGIFGQTKTIRCILLGVMVLLYLITFGKTRKKARAINSIISLVFLFQIINIIRTNIDISDYILYAWQYYYVVLAIPLFYVLNNNKWKIDKFLNALIILGVASYLLRIVVVFFEYYTGKQLFSNIWIAYSNVEWFRNGIHRMNAPFISNIIIPILSYLFIESKKIRIKVLYCLFIALALFYTYVIHSSRAMLLYQVAALIFCYLIVKRTSAKRMIVFIGALIILIGVLDSGVLSAYLSQFSINDSTYGVNSLSRLYTIGKFGAEYLKTPILGIGTLSTNQQGYEIVSTSYLSGHISDIGFLYSIFQYGVPMLMVYIILLARGFRASILTYKKKHYNFVVLTSGILFSLFITGVSMDCFSNSFIMSVPIVIAIFEYAIWDCS